MGLVADGFLGTLSHNMLLGNGILCKSIAFWLLAALGDPKFRDIFWSTIALVFIGCPHRGSLSAALQNSLSSLLRVDRSIQGQRANAMAAGFDERGVIIHELKARGAKLTLRVPGAERWWLPYELARYHDLDEEVVQLVKPDKESLEDFSTEDKRLWQYIIGKAPEHFRKGKPEDGSFCIMCLMADIGVHYLCIHCGYLLCFQCYRAQNTIHPEYEFFFSVE